MGRLKATTQHRLIKSKARLLQGALNQAGTPVRREGHRPWAKLYRTAKWQRHRLTILARDGWVCQQTNEVLIGEYPAWNSAVVDHIVPAHVFWFDGRRELFWAKDNLQSVTKQYHDSTKQSLEMQRQTGRGGA